MSYGAHSVTAWVTLSDANMCRGEQQATLRSTDMRHLNGKQRQMLIEMAHSLEDTSCTLHKQAGRLARYGAMPRFIRALLLTAQTALDEASTGLVEWANGAVNDDGHDMDEQTTKIREVSVADEDVGN